ncbi:D-cysteine desulfhydrase family protein [Rhodococcus sovatensis]|uniref:D-cysteine desulfhydrase family protein n=1 Tax=Rhodococcus sovatensis TaxID=1805840 RepID=A0ABZ2PI23_9NOCA
MPTNIYDQRTPLSFLPTPLHPLDRLSAALVPDGSTRLWIKRDDQTGLAGGGNKARKLEYLAHRAAEAGATTLVTAGAIQSNHARQTAAAAAVLGLRCVLVLAPGALSTSDYETSGNALLDRLVGAEIVIAEDVASVPAELDRVEARLRDSGEVPYMIPIGGSNPVGSLGYYRCAHEIADSGADFAEVYLATGSGGTQAGLIGGFHAADYRTRVVGVSVAAPADEQVTKVQGIIAGLMELVGSTTVPAEAATVVDDRFVGPGYGVPTDAMRDAVELVARTEGILIDPVYTGKGMAGLVHRIREGAVPKGDILFLHTGGSAGLFAYKDSLTA